MVEGEVEISSTCKIMNVLLFLPGSNTTFFHDVERGRGSVELGSEFFMPCACTLRVILVRTLNNFASLSRRKY
jgi:hypothetical protein